MLLRVEHLTPLKLAVTIALAASCCAAGAGAASPSSRTLSTRGGAAAAAASSPRSSPSSRGTQAAVASSPHSSPASRSTQAAVAADLLAVLAGPRAAARAVPAAEAARLRACLRFLAPALPNAAKAPSPSGCSSRRKADEMVRWPPKAVRRLARRAVKSGGDPRAIRRALNPVRLPVPDVEGSAKHKCQLTTYPYGRRFANEEINSYFAFLFELIVARGPSVGLNVSLSRFDLFLGHLFLASETGRLGILFQAKLYPEFDKKLFPYNLGYCQQESNVPYDDSFNLRNILWLAPFPSNGTKTWLAPGVLVALDAHPGGIIYQKMIHDYVQAVRTIYEEDFGHAALEVNYLNIANATSADRIFNC
ncbi:hypothetical protein ACP4OV_007156 [Aristida adscensionis]